MTQATCDNPGAPYVGGVSDGHEQEVSLRLLLAVQDVRIHGDLNLQLLLTVLVHAALLQQQTWRLLF